MTDKAAKVTGNMVVLRVTTAAVGDEITRVLNAYLSYTASPAAAWKQTAAWKQAEGWQLFDVIGDFGLGESKQLAQKISQWSLLR